MWSKFFFNLSNPRGFWNNSKNVYNETQLTYHESWDYDPSWSPDRKKIAYTSHRSG
ncbi:MAG TPA: hypothetical protein ENH49_03520, partial [Candidatus Marinimicrobia bacterium]|nr:hypothetical protein [Candidatus Neomarinimicrobiota bacterium]